MLMSLDAEVFIELLQLWFSCHALCPVCVPFLMDLAFISTYKDASRNIVLHITERGTCQCNFREHVGHMQAVH